MKITNGIKQDFNYKNNYKAIFKQIKEEIKSVVINKYINQVERLTKTIEKLKKENLLLKNDLIYILKRVLLNKNEYTNTNNNKNLTIYTKTQPLNRNSLLIPGFVVIINPLIQSLNFNSKMSFKSLKFFKISSIFFINFLLYSFSFR